MNILTGIGKWAKLSNSRKRTWLNAAFVLLLIGLALRLLPFAKFKSYYIKATSRFPRKPVKDANIGEVVWAVESAAQKLPMTLLCLPQALAVKYLLGVADDVVVHIGFNKEPTKDFQFHAWVEKQGQTVIGSLPTYYQPLWVWN